MIFLEAGKTYKFNILDAAGKVLATIETSPEGFRFFNETEDSVSLYDNGAITQLPKSTGLTIKQEV